MKKRLFLTILMIFAINCIYSQDTFWKKSSDQKIASLAKMDRATMPSKYQIYSLDLEALKVALSNAPLENSNLKSDIIIQFPDYEGYLRDYKVFEAPIMEKGLSDKFPNIKTYSAQSIDDSAITLRFSITHFGLHVMSLSGKLGTFYIDTFTKDLNNYIIYSRKDVMSPRNFGCLVKDEYELLPDKYELDNLRN
ncbi:MAG: hypothetical protein HC854_09240 [Flavobacterium sp.]|nr:hypothetical protein [Flavobacterium sp.]